MEKKNKEDKKSVKRRPRSKKKKTHYIDNDEFAKEVKKSQDLGFVTDELANMFIKLVDGVALMFNNLKYHGIEEDVKQDCLLLLIQKYTKYDCNANSSCFAYFTTVATRQIMYQLTKNKTYKDRCGEIAKEAMKIIEKREKYFK
jgi:uncharacterized protein YggL (DUF469 family)